MKQIALIVFLIALLPLSAAGKKEWQRDITVDGIEYSRFRRIEREPGSTYASTIGKLKEPTRVDGLQLEHYLHLRNNGTISGGLLAEGETINTIDFPAGTWVMFDSEGHLASAGLPKDMMIEGYPVRGSWGGVNSPRVSFYPEGSLKAFFPRRNVTVSGVPCKGGVRVPVRLYPDGSLRSCALGDRWSDGRRDYRKGKYLEFTNRGDVADQIIAITEESSIKIKRKGEKND